MAETELQVSLLGSVCHPMCIQKRFLLFITAMAAAVATASYAVMPTEGSTSNGDPLHTSNGDLLLLTQLVREGRSSEARMLSRVVVNNIFLGHTGFFAVNASSGQRTNQMFFWFQPCSDGCDPHTAPLIQWFNGGPGSPDTVGVFNQIGQYYVTENLELRER